METEDDVNKETISLKNVVQQVEDEMHMFESAHALLGPADDKCCTYFQGYMERQALYSCITCKIGKPSGVCLACSLQCHEGHNLIELYTKRNFQCDCGNSLFPSDFKCLLDPKKSKVNEYNEYNQNFEGTFCTCCRPYPDYDDSIEDIMMQCVICEDWLHGRHATSLDINDIEYEEMICEACLKRHPFLLKYITLCQAIYDKNIQCIEKLSNNPRTLNHSDIFIKQNEDLNKLSEENNSNFNELDTDQFKLLDSNQISNSSKLNDENVIICDTNKINILDSSVSDAIVSNEKEYLNLLLGLNANEKSSSNNRLNDNDLTYISNLSDPIHSDVKTKPSIFSSMQENSEGSTSTDSNTIKILQSVPSNNSSGAFKLKVNDINFCILLNVANIDVTYKSGAIFLPSDWREKLCHCNQCLELYELENVKFLITSTDTLKHYESKNKSIDSLATQHLSKMNHVQKIELVQGYMDLKNGLVDYLKKFENGKVVRKEDILEFFEGLKSNKKQRLE